MLSERRADPESAVALPVSSVLQTNDQYKQCMLYSWIAHQVSEEKESFLALFSQSKGQCDGRS